jgi:hypothetical protein
VIVGFDPPNHALLLHFGSAKRPSALQVEAWEMSYTPGRLSRVGTAFDPATQALVAIHFGPRGFFMPSFESERDLLARWRFVLGPSQLRIDLGAVPRLHDPGWVGPGIELFLSLPRRTGRDRPFLHGLCVQTSVQPVDLDLERIEVRVAPRSLENTQADLFVQIGE